MNTDTADFENRTKSKISKYQRLVALNSESPLTQGEQHVLPKRLLGALTLEP